jgi:hypothetical protein
MHYVPDVQDAICAVTSAQYLSPSGWVTLRDLVDNDVPFSLYRDEGSTFLQVSFLFSSEFKLSAKKIPTTKYNDVRLRW